MAITHNYFINGQIVKEVPPEVDAKIKAKFWDTLLEIPDKEAS